MSSTCGVTGASGYVGAVLAEALRRAGHEVIELNRSTAGRRSTAPTRTLVLGRTVDDAVFAGLDVLIHAATTSRSQHGTRSNAAT